MTTNNICPRTCGITSRGKVLASARNKRYRKKHKEKLKAKRILQKNEKSSYDKKRYLTNTKKRKQQSKTYAKQTNLPSVVNSIEKNTYNQRWDDQDIKILIDEYHKGTPHKIIAKILNRTVEATSRKNKKTKTSTRKKVAKCLKLKR